MKLIRKIIEAFKEWRKERLFSRLGLYRTNTEIAEVYQVDNVKEDIDEILKILGYRRRNVLTSLFNEVYNDEKQPRFEKIRKGKK